MSTQVDKAGRSQDSVAMSQAAETNEKNKAKNVFTSFFLEWNDGGATYKYRDRLIANYKQKDFQIEVDLDDLNKHNAIFCSHLREKPEQMLEVFEKAALDVVCCNMFPRPTTQKGMHTIQVQLSNWERNDVPIRNIDTAHLKQLVCVPGIVVGAGRSKCKATVVTLRCKGCQATCTVPCKPGIGGVQLPRKCEARANAMQDERCPLDPFEVVPDSCKFVDTQMLRLQEAPEDVPTGEMPQGIQMICDRKLVDKVKPGTRVRVIAVVSLRSNAGKGGNKDSSVQSTYLRVVGMDVVNKEKKTGNVLPEEEERLRLLANDKEIYEKISQSIAPAIYGHEEIKKAIACLMFGGSRKTLPDGTRLRGDINVLLLGDPSCGKSQFLKFVHQVAPICVYTSGKGSSAAGLTASVMRQNGEFVLEGGAMVLADGGVVCIDEFDKMREQDRVAIHEAMEQQTISIAKAGITATLTSRTSVLAAANPIFGRYDDLKSTSENIDFETTILSRFDLIFIIRDTKNVERDTRLASHIIGLHNHEASKKELKGPVELDDVSKLVAFARHNVRPRLTQRASAILTNHYVRFREEAKQAGASCAIPITVRQLEAIVRISESLAKMELREDATADHVKEAVRLFQLATMAAAKQGTVSGGVSGDDATGKKIQKIEKHIRRRIAIGNKCSYSKLSTDLARLGHPDGLILKAVNVMHSRGELEFINKRKMIHRKR